MCMYTYTYTYIYNHTDQVFSANGLILCRSPKECSAPEAWKCKTVRVPELLLSVPRRRS